MSIVPLVDIAKRNEISILVHFSISSRFSSRIRVNIIVSKEEEAEEKILVRIYYAFNP